MNTINKITDHARMRFNQRVNYKSGLIDTYTEMRSMLANSKPLEDKEQIYKLEASVHEDRNVLTDKNRNYLNKQVYHVHKSDKYKLTIVFVQREGALTTLLVLPYEHDFSIVDEILIA